MSEEDKIKLVASVAGNMLCSVLHMHGVTNTPPPSDDMAPVIKGVVNKALALVMEAKRQVVESHQ